MKNLKLSFILFLIVLGMFSLSALSYEIADTGQIKYFNNNSEISAPVSDAAFYGQDASYIINEPSYTDNGDGTITDNVTGLMWQKTCDFNDDGIIDVNDKMSFNESVAFVDDFTLAGYSDWRLPSIKEIYSLIVFSGLDPSGYEGNDTSGLTPFIDTDYFDFAYGDTDAGERVIDAQMVSSNLYVGNTEMMFGVNFADGRIKGYGTGPMPGQQQDKQFYVMYVRGNTDYGVNDFSENTDTTISDAATGLMWDKNDSQEGMNWEEALAWVQQKNSESYLGYSDWRLPSVKELHSIVDYSRSLPTTNSAALDAIFNCSTIVDEGDETNYPFFWSGTTHENMNNGGYASYVCFGEALGFMPDPMGNTELMDVHGAGAQRSDPKTGDPANYPEGNGPQGDVVRIYNYVRLVRSYEPVTGVIEEEVDESATPSAEQTLNNYPNPFNPATTINFSLNAESTENTELIIYNSKGQEVKTLVNEPMESGNHSVIWNGQDDSNKPVSSGIYLYKLKSGTVSQTKKMILMK